MSVETIETVCIRCGREMVVTTDYEPIYGEGFVCERCLIPPEP